MLNQKNAAKFITALFLMGSVALAYADTVPAAPEVPAVAGSVGMETPDAGEAPEAPEVAGVPEAPEVADVPDAPEVPEVAEVPEAPEIQGAPEIAEAH